MGGNARAAGDESVTGTERGPGRPGAGTRPVPAEADILRRGMETSAELGYDRATAREPARRLGVSHNVIDDRYGPKANFRRAVVDSILEGDTKGNVSGCSKPTWTTPSGSVP